MPILKSVMMRLKSVVREVSKKGHFICTLSSRKNNIAHSQLTNILIYSDWLCPLNESKLSSNTNHSHDFYSVCEGPEPQCPTDCGFGQDIHRDEYGCAVQCECKPRPSE